jgi:hypothetical protein
MFKGLARLVPGTELYLTIAHQQSATKHSGSVHKTNCSGRTVTVSQVSLGNQDCAAITGSATKVGQNETPAQINVNKSCGGNPSQHVWRSVSVCSLIGRSDFNQRPPKYSMGSFPNGKPAGARGWDEWETDNSTPPTPLSTFNPTPTPRHMTSCCTN